MAPLHPAFVHFPIALVVTSFISDLLGRVFNKASLRAAGFWSLIGALIFGAITATTGYYDMTRTRGVLGDTARYVDFHEYAGFILIGAVVVLALWRILYARKDLMPGFAYLIAAALVMGMVLFQGWYGGEMVYSQGAGVAAAGKGTEAPASGKQRLDKVTKTGE